MHPTTDRRLPAIVAMALIAVAIVGYVVGHGGSTTRPRETMVTASLAGAQLDYPSSWKAASAAPAIPGLSFANEAVIAPGGDAAKAGLIAGQLPGGEPSPLPGPFVARMLVLPQTSVVSLLEVRAYRYAFLRLRGYDRQLTLYAIPNQGAGNSTALACYAATGSADAMQACQEIVATLILVGQSQTYDLTPEPTYAHRLSASIAQLDAARVALRREMAARVTPATMQRLASRLAARFAAASSSLATLEPTPAAGQAQIVLSSSIRQARDAYAALAGAAASGSAASMIAARARVYEAEKGVDNALETFALLGYQET